MNINPGAVNRPDAVGAAMRYLLSLPFYEWQRFDAIPDELFLEVFDLIEEQFRGWAYITNDDDTAFRKQLKHEPSASKVAGAKRVNREKYFKWLLNEE